MNIKGESQPNDFKWISELLNKGRENFTEMHTVISGMDTMTFKHFWGGKNEMDDEMGDLIEDHLSKCESCRAQFEPTLKEIEQGN